MATRRQRPSVGGTLVGPSNLNRPSALEAFEDFRRRHIRQNKDIVIDNALRRTTVATLQEEIAKLHVELLELRQTNAALSTQVKRLQSESARSHSQSTREAIDQILSAVPILRQFRDTLDPVSPRSIECGNLLRAEIGTNGTWSMESKENPTATRPAAAGAGRRALAALSEGSEYGSDVEVVSTQHLRVKRISKERRRTEIGSVAAPRSPRPNMTRPAPSDYFVIDSPESTGDPSPSAPLIVAGPSPPTSPESPSPRKGGRSPNGVKMKKRRESGLLLPRARSKTPPSTEVLGEIPDWDEGRNIVIPVKKTVKKTGKEEVKGKTLERIQVVDAPTPVASSSRVSRPSIAKATTTHVNRPLLSATREGESSMSATRRGKGTAVAPSIVVDEVIEEEIPTEMPIPAPSPPLSIASNAFSELDSFVSNDDDGGRGRRARRSVNYKEPSLTKKMRKPDGVAVDDILRAGRPSLSALFPPGEDHDTAAIDHNQKQRVLQHVSGLRRKSVLPKAGSSQLPRDLYEDEEDEEELDLCLELAEAIEEIEEEEEVVEGQTTQSDGEYVPSSPATPLSGPVIAASTTSTLTRTLPRKNSVARTSPRKPVVKRPEGLGVGRMAVATSRVPSGPSAARSALSTRPEDNGVRKPTIATAGKAGVIPARRPTAAARRQSFAV